MKHIGWCLDRIQIEMAHLPKTVISHEDKQKANDIFDTVQKYTDTLAQIILNPRFREFLRRLETTQVEGIRLQAHEVEKLFEDLKHMLQVLNLYLTEMRTVVADHPEDWSKRLHRVVQMIDEKFGGERGDLRNEFNLVMHSEEELRGIITFQEHLAEFLR